MKSIDLIKNYVQSFMNRLGYEVVCFTNDISEADLRILRSVRSYTVTGPLRILAMLKATEYLEQNKILGAIVECGVWRGGSIMSALHKLVQMGCHSREVYLYDIFTSVSIDEVQQNIRQTNYPLTSIHFVAGDVKETLPVTQIGPIALLRLDTNTYESTFLELQHLYPRMVNGGVVIIDDYGHWPCARQAVNEYFDKVLCWRPLLDNIDYTGRIFIVTRQPT